MGWAVVGRQVGEGQALGLLVDLRAVLLVGPSTVVVVAEALGGEPVSTQALLLAQHLAVAHLAAPGVLKGKALAWPVEEARRRPPLLLQ